MTLTPCVEPFCGRVAEYRGRCATHARVRERDTHATGRIEHRDGRMYKRSKWEHTRQAVFKEKGRLCLTCQAEGKDTIAQEVDHIVPIEQGGEPWAIANLQPLCASHHAQKTRREQQRGDLKRYEDGNLVNVDRLQGPGRWAPTKYPR